MRALPLVILASLLAGCAAPGGPASFTERRERAANEAYVLPPPGGPQVLSVIEERFLNGIQQDLVLATKSTLPGQNRLRAQFFGPYGANTGRDNRLFNSPLDRPHTAEEMRREFPLMAMATSSIYVANKYGPFGYAVGRQGSELCIYAWQRLSSVATGTTLFDPRGTIAIRLRLCEAGATEQQLLAVMYGFTINARIGGRNWDPYGKPVGVSDDLGRAGGAAVFPAGPMGDATVLEGPLGPEPAPPAAPTRRRAPAPAPQAPAGALPDEAQPAAIYQDFPQVPPPPGGQGG
jgi:hypothetical protein